VERKQPGVYRGWMVTTTCATTTPSRAASSPQSATRNAPENAISRPGVTASVQHTDPALARWTGASGPSARDPQAGLPGTPVDLARARTYAERLRFEPLDDLTPSEARRAVTEPAAALGVAWADDALERVTNAAAGYPYFLQLHASETWDAAVGATVITAADVAAAEPRALRRLETGLYRARYQRASTGEQRYLHEVARLMTDNQVRTAAVADALGRDLSELSTVRDRLIRKGVVYSPEIGALAFSVPGFRSYVLARLKPEPEGPRP
jgi:hypothetical protein